MRTEEIHPYKIMKARSERTPHRKVFFVLKLGSQRFENFHGLCHREVFNLLKSYVNLLSELRISQNDRVAFIGRNSLEWILLDWAIMSIGAVSVPIYPQTHPDEVKFILRDSGAKWLISEEWIEGIEIAQMSFVDFDRRAQSLDLQVEPEMPASLPEVSTIIYTSGTTGEPKGVMHSLNSFRMAIDTAMPVFQLSKSDRLMSYLPLSHVAERVLIEFGSLYSGAQVYIVDRVEKAIGLLPVVRPSLFFAVPRVWETMASRIKKELRNHQLLEARLSKIPFFLRSWILSRFIKKKLGLDACRLAISGAAKISKECLQDFLNWRISICEAYGLTETLCVSTFNVRGVKKLGSIGKPYDGVELKLSDDHEICVRAPFHFKGYYGREDLTAEVLREGWFHTGDLARIDSEGYLFITDRKKSLFKGSNGKYVAPLPIESRIKARLGVVEAVVVGEGRPHCVAMATSSGLSLTEERVIQILDSINAELSSHEQIKAIGLVQRPWTSESGELTPSLKVKRQAVQRIYEREIEALYSTRDRVEFFS